MMKVAIVHDYIKEYGGAERVLEALHEVWPDAPVFTTVYLPEFLGPHRGKFRGWNIKTSFLQYLPFKAKLISPIRLIAPFVFKAFDFSQFDAVIVSATGAYSPNGIKIKNQKSKIKNVTHICYCHTPPRYLYGFATAREWKNNLLFRILGELANHFLRLVDFKSAQNVDYFIANSRNVAGRIKKFYRRDSTVIYPPVDVPKDTKILRYKDIEENSKEESLNIPVSQYPNISSYYLAGGRIARPKHIGLIIKTFEKINLSLVVFGREFAGSNDFKIQNSKIKFVGEITDEEKLTLMRGAKAYIFASEDEDFGITPVEAMSVGTPVIAYKSGGVVESVVDGKTGVFFNDLTVDSLSKAIKQSNDLTINPNDCVKQAEKFNKERFKEEIKEFVEGKIEH